MDKGLGIYIHIPFCKRKCDYCAFVSQCDFSLEKRYIEALCREIRERGTPDTVTTVYVGGGTPSTIESGRLCEVFDCLRASFTFSTDCEITVEANPESVTEDFCGAIKKSGVNRVSLGLQSSDDEILKSIGRIHRASDFPKAVDRLRNVGITNISGDIILGLPGQDEEKVLCDADFLMSAHVKHISAYALQVEEGTPLFKRGAKVDPDYQADLYDAFYSRISRGGFVRYEVSNFAVPGYESRHNLKYWIRAPYLGFGAAAHSFYDGKRGYNTSDVRAYCDGKRDYTETVLSAADLREERIMLALRTVYGLDLAEFERSCGENLLVSKSKEIDRLLRGGFIEIDGGALRATDKGIYVLSSIITELI